MKRVGFKKPTFKTWVAEQQAKQACKRIALLAKTRPTVDLSRQKPPSAAAIAGKARSKQNAAETDKLETAWKLEVRIRDDYSCQYPSCTAQDLHIDVHHLNPRSQRKDLIYVVSNGLCLCRIHHQWVGDNPIEAKEKGLLITRSREIAEKEKTLGAY